MQPVEQWKRKRWVRGVGLEAGGVLRDSGEAAVTGRGGADVLPSYNLVGTSWYCGYVFRSRSAY